MEHVEIKCETECNVSVKAEPMDDGFEDGTEQSLCVTEMRSDVSVKNNTKEQHCIVKLEPEDDDTKEGYQPKEDIVHVIIKCEPQCNISVKTEPTDEDFEEGTAQALCVTELKTDDQVTNNTTEQECISNNTIKGKPTQAKDKTNSKKRKPRRVKRENSKKHECKICHKHLSGISSLKAHYRTHTGEKPYECNVCDNKFAQKAHLEMHLRTHTGGKPYECNICQTRFTQKINLQRHFRSHNGEKPYECKICQNRFTRKSALLRHAGLHLDGS